MRPYACAHIWQRVTWRLTVEGPSNRYMTYLIHGNVGFPHGSATAFSFTLQKGFGNTLLKYCDKITVVNRSILIGWRISEFLGSATPFGFGNHFAVVQILVLPPLDGISSRKQIKTKKVFFFLSLVFKRCTGKIYLIPCFYSFNQTITIFEMLIIFCFKSVT